MNKHFYGIFEFSDIFKHFRLSNEWLNMFYGIFKFWIDIFVVLLSFQVLLGTLEWVVDE